MSEIMSEISTIVYTYGVNYACYSKPVEQCLKNYAKEPCKMCLEKYAKQLLSKLVYYSK